MHVQIYQQEVCGAKRTQSQTLWNHYTAGRQHGKWNLKKNPNYFLRKCFGSQTEIRGQFTRAIIISDGVLLNHAQCQKNREFSWRMNTLHSPKKKC